MFGNWTEEEVRKVVITELEINQNKCVNLDVERADRTNMNQIVFWCEKMGYSAEINESSETITVKKSK